MKLETNSKLQDQEVNKLKRENNLLKVIIFLLVILILNLCIEVWKLSFVSTENEYSYQVITNIDKSKEFMSFEFIEIK